MYWGDYSGQHYSALTQITPNNARQLKTAWSFPILGGNSVLEATPIVVDGVMYTTGSGNPATVTAIDARSGRQIWRWTRQQKIVNPYEINPFARGVAILGNRIFRRHARRRACGGGRANRPDDLGTAGRRHDGGLEHHEPSARAERHGHYRHDRRRVRDERPSGCVRRGDRQTQVALLHHSRAGRTRQRHVEGRQLEDRRRPDVADRQLRSRTQPRVLGGRQSGARVRSRVREARWTTSIQQLGCRARCRHRAS